MKTIFGLKFEAEHIVRAGNKLQYTNLCIAYLKEEEAAVKVTFNRELLNFGYVDRLYSEVPKDSLIPSVYGLLNDLSVYVSFKKPSKRKKLLTELRKGEKEAPEDSRQSFKMRIGIVQERIKHITAHPDLA